MGSSDVKSLLVWAVLRPINESVPFVKKAAKNSRFTEKKKHCLNGLWSLLSKRSTVGQFGFFHSIQIF